MVFWLYNTHLTAQVKNLGLDVLQKSSSLQNKELLKCLYRVFPFDMLFKQLWLPVGKIYWMWNVSKIFWLLHVSKKGKLHFAKCLAKYSMLHCILIFVAKTPRSDAALQKCSYEKMQRIYCRTPMSKRNFTEITLRHGCSPVKLQHIFGSSFPKNTSGGLLLFIK